MRLFYPIVSVGTFLADVVGLLMLCVIAEIAISWIFAMGGRVPVYHPIIRRIRKVSEAITKPLRDRLPMLRFGEVGLDLAPMVALIALGVIMNALAALPF